MRHAHSLLALQAAAAMAPLPWGKRPCQDYLKALREHTPARLDDDLVECHPLRHLRWTAGVAEEEDSSPLPPQLAFDARNSACHADRISVPRESQYAALCCSYTSPISSDRAHSAVITSSGIGT